MADFLCGGDTAAMGAAQQSSSTPPNLAPLTLHKEAIIKASGSPLRHYLEAALQSGHLLATLGKEFTMDTLQRQLATEGYGPQAKSVKEVGLALKAAGVLPVRSSVNGTRTRLHRLPETGPREPDEF